MTSVNHATAFWGRKKTTLKTFYNKGQILHDTLNKPKEKFVPGYTKYLDKMSFFVYDDE